MMKTFQAFPLKELYADEANEKNRLMDMQLKQLQLNSLLQITEAINQNFTKNQLLKIYEFVLRSQLKVDKLLLFVYDQEWDAKLAYGLPDDFNPDFIEQVITSNDYNGIKNAVLDFEHVIPVFHKDYPLAYAFITKNNTNSIDFKNDLLPFIQTITNLVIVALENKKMSKDLVKQAGIRKELALAAQMQTLLFPERLPNLDDVDMAAFYLPHQEVGGDYYDFIQVNEREFLICMADVSGKGMAAALMMSNFQATLHALAKNCDSLVDLVEQLNDSVTRSAKGEKFITLFICKFDVYSKELRYINAGHNPPVLISNDNVMLLEEGTIGLGMFEKLPPIKEGVIQAKPGNEYLLFCYTDGVVELEDENGEHFGLNRLEHFLRENAHISSMNELQSRIVQKLYDFKENKPFLDDIALLACRCSF